MKVPGKLASAAAAVIFAAACGVPQIGTGELQTTTRQVELDGAESVDVELHMGAGELTVRGGASRLMDGTFRFNVPEWEPVVDYKAGPRASLRVQQGDGPISLGRTENEWDLRFDDAVPIALEAHLGAGEATMTIGSLNLSRLEIHQGVGELDLDLRGQPRQSYAVSINGGVGSANVRVPRSVAIVATATGGIGSINVEGLEQRGDAWHNPGHENDPVKIQLDVKGGIGEIVIRAEDGLPGGQC